MFPKRSELVTNKRQMGETAGQAFGEQWEDDDDDMGDGQAQCQTQ